LSFTYKGAGAEILAARSGELNRHQVRTLQRVSRPRSLNEGAETADFRSIAVEGGSTRGLRLDHNHALKAITTTALEDPPPRKKIASEGAGH